MIDRTALLAALARADGQHLDGYDLGHTAEVMYGKQADAVLALVAAEHESVLRILDETIREAEGHLAVDDPEPCEDGGHDCHAAARFALAHRIRRALTDVEQPEPAT